MYNNSAAPTPLHLLRSHAVQLSTLLFSPDNERIYSGDISGFVVVTSSRSLRAITSWKAHTDGILGIQESQHRVITHGRDNKLHVWSCIVEPSSSDRLGDSAALPSQPIPDLYYSMDVNSLNFCRFSLWAQDTGRGPSETPDNQQLHKQEPEPTMHGLIALPNLVKASLVDIWGLPSCRRLHASIGVRTTTVGQADTPTGIIMAMHLFSTNVASSTSSELRLACAYENGAVILRRYTQSADVLSVQGKGWEVIWQVKSHVESIMAMAISSDNSFALTVSADHLVGRYDMQASNDTEISAVHRTKHPGNSAVAIRSDGRVCAIGGWDGKIRLYSTKTMKSLGTLAYHKTGCQSVAFTNHSAFKEGFDEDMTVDETLERSRWLLGAGKDGRVSIWSLMSFEKSTARST